MSSNETIVASTELPVQQQNIVQSNTTVAQSTQPLDDHEREYLYKQVKQKQEAQVRPLLLDILRETKYIIVNSVSITQ